MVRRGSHAVPCDEETRSWARTTSGSPSADGQDVCFVSLTFSCTPLPVADPPEGCGCEHAQRSDHNHGDTRGGASVPVWPGELFCPQRRQGLLLLGPHPEHGPSGPAIRWGAYCPRSGLHVLPGESSLAGTELGPLSARSLVQRSL